LSALAALLTLADSRLPAGGHAHSGGAEEACALGLIHDEPSLESFLARRLTTAGRVAASLAAAACRAAAPADRTAPGGASRAGLAPTARDRGPAGSDRDPAGPDRDPAAGDHGPGACSAALAALDGEAEARVPSPALRKASRAQGRGLVRVGRQAWPSSTWDLLPAAPHHPIAIGVAAHAAGLSERDAATAAAYLALSGPATAAQRLLGMDPMKVAAATARLAAAVDALADAAAADRTPAAHTDPLLDLLAERHATRTERYFAS
jgi:urease accessory protein